MKLFLILLSTSLYLLSCSFEANSSPEPKPESQSVEQPQQPAPEKTYTITHAANDNEEVSIFLQVPETSSFWGYVFPDDPIDRYEVSPQECLKISESQFSNLMVHVGPGSLKNILFSSNALCSADDTEKKCQPGHYNIVDQGHALHDEYVMESTDEPSDTTHCQDILSWMKSKEN